VVCGGLVESREGISGRPRATKKAPAITPPGQGELRVKRTAGIQPYGKTIWIVTAVQIVESFGWRKEMPSALGGIRA
jgi:hypothetical protein